MKLTVYYEAIDPYYSSHDQTFIGPNEESCYRQKDEYEEWLGRNHPNSIINLYKVIIKDSFRLQKQDIYYEKI